MAKGPWVSSSDAPGIPVVLFVETGRWQAFSDLAAVLRSRGVRVVRVSRCAYGQVVGDAPEAVAFSKYALSAVKARIALMLDIASEA